MNYGIGKRSSGEQWFGRSDRAASAEGVFVDRSRDAQAQQALVIARLLADLLDRRFTIPGTSIRIGLDPILGLVPGIGDIVANLMGSAIIFIAARFGVPKVVLLRMGINVAINSLIGAIPILGDVFSIGFRSNVKNLELLEKYATRRRASTAGDWLFVSGIFLGFLFLAAAAVLGLVWMFKYFFGSL